MVRESEGKHVDAKERELDARREKHEQVIDRFRGEHEQLVDRAEHIRKELEELGDRNPEGRRELEQALRETEAKARRYRAEGTRIRAGQGPAAAAGNEA